MSSNSTPITRGAFIVLEGLDRSGKTTQCARLHDFLSAAGHHVHSMRFPDRSTAIGQTINAYLTSTTVDNSLPDQAIHLLFAANRWELASTIEGLLTSGTTIVCDRYYHSGMVYSAAKQNPALTLHWARQAEVGLPEPDLVVFLDLEPEEQERRGGWGVERYEESGMQRRVRNGFLELLAEDEERAGRSSSKRKLLRIDAGRGVDDVARDVQQTVTSVIKHVQDGGTSAVAKVIGK